MKYRLCIFYFLFIGLQWGLHGQVYTMQNLRVDDCRGTLLGSGNGQLPGHYDHDENYTFTICVPGARSISIQFSAFCTEQGYDFLRIFDGADTFATQVGPAYSGTTIPPAFTSSGPCVTIHFLTDDNVTCTGWVMNWRTRLEAPELPRLLLPTATANCSTRTLTVNFDQKIPCDSVYAAAFSLGGAVGNSVTSASPVNCQNDSTQTVRLNFSPGLNQSGYYGVTYSGQWRDPCDSVWTLTTSDTLAVRDCPLEVDLIASPMTICEGDCANLRAEARGGDFLTYQFAWNPSLPNSAGPHSVCPTTTTTYTVTVSDRAGSQPASANVTVTVLPAPQMPPPVTLCESATPIILTATPSGGVWRGPGIIDSTGGVFDPGDAGDGVHTVQYFGPNGCPGEMQVTVSPIEAGLGYAFCPGSLPVQLSDVNPANGTWSGPNVTPNGFFTPPSTPGRFRLAYTVAGCTDSVTVVVDSIRLTPVDTVCASQPPFNFTFSPPYGFWQGNGITSSRRGRFDAGRAGLGQHTLTYSIFGCRESFDIFVKDIEVEELIYACPQQPPFVVPAARPPGGTWSGPGVLDPNTGRYDPGTQSSNHTDTLRYSVDGCLAKMVVRVRQTRVDPDTFTFCRYDASMRLDYSTTGRWPPNGDWQGPGVIQANNPGRFDPKATVPGWHTLTYLANTCAATLPVFIYPPTLQADTSLCTGSPPFTLRTNAPGGGWRGPGITDTTQGLFSSAAAGLGRHRIVYRTPFGCLDSMWVEVVQPPSPSIDNLDPAYCYRDTLIGLLATPSGGQWSGPVVNGNFFNPAAAGPGRHFITYEIGEGACARTATGITTVGDSLILTLPWTQDSICAGEFVRLQATGTGGATGRYFFDWEPLGRSGAEIPINPTATTNYVVTLTDGCSEPVSGNVRVSVAPDFSIELSNSDPVCFGQEGWVAVDVNGPNAYEVVWETEPPVVGDTLRQATDFNLPVRITDLISGCEKNVLGEIPATPFVRAAFTPNPNGECVRLPGGSFSFLDQSAGAVTGEWDFGDGTRRPYVRGEQISHTYAEIGTYRVLLRVAAEACVDSISQEICVEPERSAFYVPTAFSPNGDLHNETFGVVANGLREFELQIFSRWGNLLFETDNPSDHWDGTFGGRPMPEGVYVWVIRGSIVDDENPLTGYAPVQLRESGTVTLLR